MTHEDALAAMPLIVLGEADAPTRARLSVHVRDCAECRLALADSWTAIDAIGRAVPQVEPPASLRARVLAGVTVSVPPAVRQEMPPTRARTPWPWGLAAAASLLAAVSLAGWLATRSEVHELRASLDALQSALDTQRGEAAKAVADAQQQVQLLEAAVLTADDLVQVPLHGQAHASAARARVFVSQSRGMIFTAHGLPALEPRQVYQLWAMIDGNPVSAGVFGLDAQGAGRVAGPLPVAGTMPQAVAVTLEPDGGMPSPTGPKVLVSS